MSKIFIFSGHFGSGKSLTAYSFIPQGHKAGTPIHRLVLDHEIRFDTYISPDDKDYPAKMQFAFIPLGKGRIGGPEIFRAMELVHTKKYTNKPDVIIMDDVAMSQAKMSAWWQDKANCTKTATLYGLQNDRCLMAKTWKPSDPGTVNFFKSMFTEFMLDCKDQEITVILTSPLHNIWENYGKPGYASDGMPNMRIVGKSAKVWDCWQQMADVIWVLDRHDKDGKLISVPRITMDVQIPKASLPGVPESFEWPGWVTLWDWYEKRTHVADVSKLQKPKPEFEREDLEKMLQKDKALFIKEMKGKATIKQITDALSDPMAPVYTKEDRESVKEFVIQWISENEQHELSKNVKVEIPPDIKEALSSGNVSKPSTSNIEDNPPEEPPLE